MVSLSKCNRNHTTCILCMSAIKLNRKFTLENSVELLGSVNNSKIIF